MLDDIPQSRKSHDIPVRTRPRDSSVGAEHFKALLAAAQICKQYRHFRYYATARSHCFSCANYNIRVCILGNK